ncbi:MAG: hypothetical protein ABIJ91_00780 [Candidatus Kuenenbacteria bacterium]
MKKIFFSIFIIAVVLFSMPAVILALGQMSEPIIIENAQRGESYEQEIFIVNNEDNVAKVDLVAEGDIVGWTKFYAVGDFENVIDSTMLKALGSGKVMAIFSVPDDAANGEYKGVIGVVRKPGETTSGEEEDGSSTAVSQRIDREVTIIVGGEERVGLAVSVIPKTYDLKTGENLSIRLIYDNQGNVALKPQVDLKIKNDEGQTFYSAIFPYSEEEPAVRSLAQYEVPALEIPTTGLAKGKYRAELKFLHNGEIVFEKDFRFSVGTGGFVLGASIAKLKGLWWILGVIVLIATGMLVINGVGKLAKKRG